MKNRLGEILGYAMHCLSFVLYPWLISVLDAPDVLTPLRFVGWAILGLGIVLIVTSIVALRGNQSGELIQRGIYGMVRHPMYVGAMLAFASWTLMHPHWVTLLLSLINMTLVYRIILQADQRNLARFGAEYEQYMADVPRMNVFVGAIRAFQRR